MLLSQKSRRGGKVLESILLVLVLSIDAFAASIAYGLNDIKIPIRSILVIDFICAFFLGLSMLIGSMFRMLIPERILIIISFFILLSLGIYYLFEGIVKANLEKVLKSNRKIKVNVFNLGLIVEIYVDQTKADINFSKDLSSKEALYLGAALSLDSIAVGFGSGIMDINYLQVVIFSLIFGIIAIWGGLLVGRKFALNTKIDLSWLSGIILIILAISKIL